jgi:hypothetical protein
MVCEERKRCSTVIFFDVVVGLSALSIFGFCLVIFMRRQMRLVFAPDQDIPTLAMSDVGDIHKQLPEAARPIILSIEETADFIRKTAARDVRARLAEETLARYLPDTVQEYFDRTTAIENPAMSRFAEKLLQELATLENGLATVKAEVVRDYEADQPEKRPYFDHVVKTTT